MLHANVFLFDQLMYIFKCLVPQAEIPDRHKPGSNVVDISFVCCVVLMRKCKR